MIAKCNKFRKLRKIFQPKWCLGKLKDEIILDEFKKKTDKLNTDKTEWEEMKIGIRDAANEVLGKGKLERRKPWMTLEILELIKERNKVKKKGNSGKYKEITNLITLKCRQEEENLDERKE